MPYVILYFIIAIIFWSWINYTIIFNYKAIGKPAFDKTTGQLLTSEKDFQHYILLGEVKPEKFTLTERVVASLIIAFGLIFFGIRLTIELWLIDQASSKLNKWISNFEKKHNL
jgi:hypothetical protein